MNNCDTIHISSYAVRPKPVFENAVVNTSILLFQKTETPCQHLYSTKMHRRGNEFDLQKLIDNLNFSSINRNKVFISKVRQCPNSITRCHIRQTGQIFSAKIYAQRVTIFF